MSSVAPAKTALAPAASPAAASATDSAPRSFPALSLLDLASASELKAADPWDVGGSLPRENTPEIVLASALMPEESSLGAAASIEGFADEASRRQPPPEDVSFLASMWGDCGNFYSLRSLTSIGLGVGVAAILANSDLDYRIQSYGQHHARSEESDEWARVNKMMGEGLIMLPAYASAMFLDCVFRDDYRGGVVAVWGERSLRATAVGAPMLLFLQSALGASRPNGQTGIEVGDSRWKFWGDSHGVSGHAFMGAIPFLTAANLSDNVWIKMACYGGSLGAGWSRLNDNAHFPSQVALGWWLAFWATCAVDETDFANENWRVVPLPVNNGVGVALEFQR